MTGLELQDAAAQVGIAPAYLSRILAGQQRPAKHQAAISKLCGATPEELFGPFTNPSLRRRSEGSTRRIILKKERRA